MMLQQSSSCSWNYICIVFSCDTKKNKTNNPTLLIFISLCLLGIVNTSGIHIIKFQALFIPMHIVANGNWKNCLV